MILLSFNIKLNTIIIHILNAIVYVHYLFLDLATNSYRFLCLFCHPHPPLAFSSLQTYGIMSDAVILCQRNVLGERVVKRFVNLEVAKMSATYQNK
jgi:hypothetical protein